MQTMVFMGLHHQLLNNNSKRRKKQMRLHEKKPAKCHKPMSNSFPRKQRKKKRLKPWPKGPQFKWSYWISKILLSLPCWPATNLAFSIIQRKSNKLPLKLHIIFLLPFHHSISIIIMFMFTYLSFMLTTILDSFETNLYYVHSITKDNYRLNTNS